VAMFLGAEKVERIFTARRNGGEAPEPAPRQPRRLALGAVGIMAVMALATLAVPTSPSAAETRPAAAFSQIAPERLATRIIDEPWSLRILDLRSLERCQKARVPGAECVPWGEVGKLGLQYSNGARDLVLIHHATLDRVPAGANKYPGKVFALRGGSAGWRAYALKPPKSPGEGATEAQRQAHLFRAALHSAMTGRKPAPPPRGVKKFVPAPRKKKGGGCG